MPKVPNLVLEEGTWIPPTVVTEPSQYKEATSLVSMPTDATAITVIEMDAAETWTSGTTLIIEFYAPALSVEGVLGGQVLFISLFEGDTELGYLAQISSGDDDIDGSRSIFAQRRLAASGAAQTFKVKGRLAVAHTSAGDWISGGAGGVTTQLPMFLSVRPL